MNFYKLLSFCLPLIFIFDSEKAEYEAVYIFNSINNKELIKITTLINPNHQLSFNETMHLFDSILYSPSSQAEKERQLANVSNAKYRIKTLVNFQTGYTKVSGSPVDGQHFYVDSTILDWEIYPDVKMINTYSCQKANVTYKGRNYTAWFAKHVPIPAGPYKFYGLPGLIIKIYDDEQKFSFELSSLKKSVDRQLIFFHKRPKELSFNDIRKLYIFKHEDPWNFILQNFTVTFENPEEARAIAESNKPKNYEFMELLPD